MINDISRFKLLTGEDTEGAHVKNIEILNQRYPQFDAAKIEKIYNDVRAPMDTAPVKRFNATFAFKHAREVLEGEASRMTSGAIKHSDESSEHLSKPKHLARQVRDRIEKNEYERLLKEHFSNSPDEISKYYYFDTDKLTANAQLLAQQMRFRLRTRVDSILLQLETSREGEKNELVQEIISPEQVAAVVEGHIPEGPIKDRLSSIGITGQFQMVGMTESVRRTTEILNGYAELERTRYPDGKVFHQIEYRAQDTDTAVIRQALGLSMAAQRAPGKLSELFAHLKRRKPKEQ